jgi:carbamoyl-phosphate synthase large subunit
MKILITAIGKRVQLIRYLKGNSIVIGVDSGDMTPTANFVDKFYKIPKCSEKGYVETLLQICQREKISLLIPLHEYEFYILCDNRNKFDEIGTTLMLSSRKILDICQNKFNTYKFFRKVGIDTPRSYSKEQILIKLKEDFNLTLPLIIKPINGMGSEGVFKINNIKELEFFIDYVKNPIIQEYVEGIEYTIDVLCDLYGYPLSIVPRERIEVRSGEVSKTRTVKNKEIIKKTCKIIEALNKEISNSQNLKQEKAVGPYTIQCKINSQNVAKFIEINPRFGGGVPITFEAGVDYGNFFEMMVEGKQIQPIIGQFKEITMLRYDDAVFLK